MDVHALIYFTYITHPSRWPPIDVPAAALQGDLCPITVSQKPAIHSLLLTLSTTLARWPLQQVVLAARACHARVGLQRLIPVYREPCHASCRHIDVTATGMHACLRSGCFKLVHLWKGIACCRHSSSPQVERL